MYWVPVFKVVFAFMILVSASWSDWRTRTASDSYWILIGCVGFLFLAIKIFQDGVSPLYYLFMIPLGIFFFDIFWDRPEMFKDGMYDPAVGAYMVAFLVLGTLVVIFGGESYLWELMVIPILIFIFIVMYYVDMIKGGADTKALISLAILFPVYPLFDGYPLIQIPMESAQFFFPFAFLVLFNAALFVMIFPLIFLLLNTVRGDRRFPAMLFGYRMDIDKADDSFVWILDRIENGSVEFRLFPSDLEDQSEKVERLRSMGVERVWVTPKIPFLIPIAISVLFSALVGNLFFLFIG